MTDVFDTKKVELAIQLHNPVVLPGSVLQGSVTARVAVPDFSAVALRLKIVGKERLQRRVYADDGATAPRTSEIVRKDVCVHKQLVTLWGMLKDGGRRDSAAIPAGEYVYPFELQLPLNVPYSFRIEDGDDKAAIEYYVKAYVEIPMGHDAKRRVPFFVLPAMPLRQWLVPCPIAVERVWSATRCGCCGSIGQITCRMSLDRSVFALDRDTLVGTFDIDNTRSRVAVDRVSLRLVSQCRVTMNSHGASIERCCGTATEAVCVAAGERKTVVLTIPFVPAQCPPSIATERIRNAYDVRFELEASFLGDVARQDCRVLLGYTVDAQNAQMAINTNTNLYPRFDEACRKEFKYVVPAQPLVVPYTLPEVSYAKDAAPPMNLPPASNHITTFPDFSLWGAPLLGASNGGMLGNSSLGAASRSNHNRNLPFGGGGDGGGKSALSAAAAAAVAAAADGAAAGSAAAAAAAEHADTAWRLPDHPLRTAVFASASCAVSVAGGDASTGNISAIGAAGAARDGRASMVGGGVGGGGASRTWVGDTRSVASRASMKSQREERADEELLVSLSAGSGSGGTAGHMPRAASSSHENGFEPMTSSSGTAGHKVQLTPPPAAAPPPRNPHSNGGASAAAPATPVKSQPTPPSPASPAPGGSGDGIAEAAAVIDGASLL
jgi:hypothetical protein